MILSNEFFLFHSGEWTGQAKLIQISTGKLIKKIKWSCCKCGKTEMLTHDITEFSPDGKYLYIHLDCATVGIIDCATGDLISTMKIGESLSGYESEIIKFSKDDKWLGTSYYGEGSGFGRTKIWDIKTGKLIWQIQGYLHDFHPVKPLALINQESGCWLVSLDSVKVLFSCTYLGYDDWVVRYHPGLFDASPGAMDKIYFGVDGDKVDSKKLRDKYYEPGLWEKIISGRSLRTIEN